MNYVPFRVSVSVRITFSRMRTGRYKLEVRVLDHFTTVKLNLKEWFQWAKNGIFLWVLLELGENTVLSSIFGRNATVALYPCHDTSARARVNIA